ncbi:hydrophobin-like protein [Pyrenophora tritici-repentis]|nr:Hydrophobin [Pyrenophora tritici-repentis]PZD31192.1 hydrophobin-like protein [Pyrenophora tritici-repentis]
MHSTIFTFTTILGLSAAAAIVPRQNGVCGPLTTPLCCQADVAGVANLACANAGIITTLDAFQAQCALTGTTAQCCLIALGSDGLVCTEA